MAQLEFPLIRSKTEFEHGEPPAVITEAQETIHMVDQASDDRRQRWLAQMQRLGAAGR